MLQRGNVVDCKRCFLDAHVWEYWKGHTRCWICAIYFLTNNCFSVLDISANPCMFGVVGDFLNIIIKATYHWGFFFGRRYITTWLR